MIENDKWRHKLMMANKVLRDNTTGNDHQCDLIQSLINSSTYGGFNYQLAKNTLVEMLREWLGDEKTEFKELIEKVNKL